MTFRLTTVSHGRRITTVYRYEDDRVKVLVSWEH